MNFEFEPMPTYISKMRCLGIVRLVRKLKQGRSNVIIPLRKPPGQYYPGFLPIRLLLIMNLMQAVPCRMSASGLQVAGGCGHSCQGGQHCSFPIDLPLPCPKKKQKHPKTPKKEPPPGEGVLFGTFPLGRDSLGNRFKILRKFHVITKAFVRPEPYDCVDLFSGKRAISKAYIAQGKRACSLDFAHDEKDVTCC